MKIIKQTKIEYKPASIEVNSNGKKNKKHIKLESEKERVFQKLPDLHKKLQVSLNGKDMITKMELIEYISHQLLGSKIIRDVSKEIYDLNPDAYPRAEYLRHKLYDWGVAKPAKVIAGQIPIEKMNKVVKAKKPRKSSKSLFTLNGTDEVSKDELIDYLSEQLLENKRIDEIAEEIYNLFPHLNPYPYNLRKILYSWNVVKPAKERVDQTIKNRILSGYLSRKGITELREEFRCHPDFIKKTLDEFGVRILNSAEARHLTLRLESDFHNQPDDITNEIIEKLMLGDSYLNLVKFSDTNSRSYVEARRNMLKLQREINSDSSFRHLISEFNHLVNAILDAEFNSFGLHTSILQVPWLECLSHRINLDSGLRFSNDNGKLTSILSTKFNINIQSKFNRFYRKPNSDEIKRNKKVKRVKKIPNDLDLTPTGLLCLFIDDGTTQKNKGMDYFRVNLLTLQFSMEEQIFLQKHLYERFNIKSEIVQRFYDDYDYDYFYQYIRGKSNVSKFFETLEKADPFLLRSAKMIFPWKFSTRLFKKDHISKCIDLYLEKEWKHLVVPTKHHIHENFE